MALLMVEHIEAALHLVRFETIAEDGTVFGAIPEFPSVWANADNVEECRDELAEVPEGWLLLGIAGHDQLPIMNDIGSTVRRAA